MEKIGYSLIDASNNEVWHVGYTKGQLTSIPSVIPLPNGDQVHCANVGDTLGDWRLVERWIDDPAPAFCATTGRVATFDGTKIVVTVSYEATPSIPPPTPLTAAEKLAAAGLSVEELKTLLGLPQ